MTIQIRKFLSWVYYPDPDVKSDIAVSLSLRRAISAKDYLTKRGGIDGARISTTGKGRENPIGDNSTPVGRAKNRRVDIEILDTREVRQERWG